MSTPTTVTYEDAAENVRQQDEAAAIRRLRQRRQQYDRASERAKKLKKQFEATVALTVSGDPTRPDWYAQPGPLSREVVMAIAGLSSLKLDALMGRFQRARPTRGKRGGRR
jgi:hypothetical protein